MNKISTCLASCLLLVNGCSTENNYLTETDVHNHIATITRPSPVVSYKTFGDMDNYISLLDTTKNALHIREMRFDQINDRTYRNVFLHNVNLLNPQDFMQRLKIDGINPFSESARDVNYFGKTLSISLENENHISLMASSASYTTASTIHIVSPDISLAEQRTPLCYAGDFVVRWNSDPTNTNGVVIGIRWTGTMIFGDDYPATEVVCLESFPDTGIATLNPLIFENIPDTAYCQLIVLRGSTETISLDGNLVRVINESGDMIKFALIKNIRPQIN